MKIETLRHWFVRAVPLWVRCLGLGLALSYLIALGHWVLIEVGSLPRFCAEGMRTGLMHPDADAGGVAALEFLHRAATGLPQRGWDQPDQAVEYRAIAYGWPLANWAAVFHVRGAYFWQDGVSPVIAISVRPLWPDGHLPDPYRPELTRLQAASMGPSGCPAPTRCTDAFQRYVPVFPLFLPSLLAAALYGLPFYVWLKRRELRGRRGNCEHCGYDLRGLPRQPAVCPECGSRGT